jgi:group I intron endonuclease
LNSNGSNIYKAILKYGHENFIFKILEYCPIKDLMVREQYYLDTLEPEYNILKFARSSRGYLHTEATKELLSSKRKSWEFSPLIYYAKLSI